MHSERILRNWDKTDDLGKKHASLKLPNVILHLSNAKNHEIEQMLRKIAVQNNKDRIEGIMREFARL